jgi:subtilisin-like proprotein convertase family protein
MPRNRTPAAAVSQAMRPVFLAVVITLVSLPARADVLTATLGQPLREVSHAVDVRIENGVARYVVQRAFANEGATADEAVLEIHLPYGAAVTGLRIRARNRWYTGDLMEREKAAAMYQELTGMGAWEPKDPALLQWVWPGMVMLQVFPVMPGGHSTVEYTLTVPTSYQDGRYVLSYPRVDGDAERLVPPVVRVTPGHGDAQTPIDIDGVRVPPDAAVVIGPPPPLPWAGEGEPDRSAGHAVSSIEIQDLGPAAEARVRIELEHTYRSDLRIALVTPKGKHLVLLEQEGAGENDVKKTFTVALPPGTTSDGTWSLVVSDLVQLDSGKLDKWSITLAHPQRKQPAQASATDTPRFVPDAPEGGDAGYAIIEVAPPPMDTALARLGRAVASPKRSFVRLEVDAAPELRPLPRAPAVVFAIDASHSMDQAGIDAQLGLARAYLRHVPDARADVVLYRRRAERLIGRLVGTGAFDLAIEQARAQGRLAPGNGSALDAGMALAAETLRGQRGPGRVVVTTDGRLRTAFQNGLALTHVRALPAGTVVHVVIPSLDPEDKIAERRDDAHALAPIARAGGGVLLQLAGAVGRPAEALAASVLGLVRPIRIDHFAIQGLPAGAQVEEPQDEDGDADDALVEGSGRRFFVSLDKRGQQVNQVVLTGEIWAQPFRRVIQVSPAFSRVAAAFVFGEDRHGDLSNEEMLALAFFGRAVSPVTSYLAIEPGVRPSRIGIPGRGEGMGSGAGGGVLGGSLGGTLKPPDLARLLAPAAEECLRKHARAGERVALRVETTSHEVVDVVIASGPAAAAQCVAEAAWALRLPEGEFFRERAWFDVSFP